MRLAAQIWKANPTVVIRIPRRPRTPAVSPVARAEGQLESLVTQIFFPASGARTHAMFAAAGGDTALSDFCQRIGGVLAELSGMRVGIVDNTMRSRDLTDVKKKPRNAINGEPWRSYCSAISENLWHIPPRLLYGNIGSEHNEELLRHEVETALPYWVIGSAAGDGNLRLLSAFCDATVLVITANQTRREAALRAKELLEQQKPPLLGTILDQRIFPVPEAIYRRL